MTAVVAEDVVSQPPMETFINDVDGKLSSIKKTNKKGKKSQVQVAKVTAEGSDTCSGPAADDNIDASSELAPQSLTAFEDVAWSGADTESAARWGHPLRLSEDSDRAAEVIEHLSSCGLEGQQDVVDWLLEFVEPLSLSRQGTRVVQNLFDIVNSTNKERIGARLRFSAQALYESAHGNHVLAQLIEQLPPASVQFVVATFLGKEREVSRHNYGCRVMERLLERCADEGNMSRIIDAIVEESEPLCRHPYGNFVVQRLLEQGSPARRSAIFSHVAHKLPALSTHRTASHFVQQLVDYSDDEGKLRIMQELLHSPSPFSLQDVGGSRYGSFVLDLLASLPVTRDIVRAALLPLLPAFTQQQIKWVKRVLDRLQIPRPTAGSKNGNRA